jgi:predicted molibdopterin-dependent oxidoreductase YjgC
VQVRARVSGTRPGVVFLPFHYGYFDATAAENERAANELTRTNWDPVSKQPTFKLAAVRVTRVDGDESATDPAPATPPTRTSTSSARPWQAAAATASTRWARTPRGTEPSRHRNRK